MKKRKKEKKKKKIYKSREHSNIPKLIGNKSGEGENIQGYNIYSVTYVQHYQYVS